MNAFLSSGNRHLQLELTRQTVRIRTHREGASLAVPRVVEVDEYRFGYGVYKRIRIMLRSNGCCKPTCTMCPLPNEALDPKKSVVLAEDYVAQVRSALLANPDCEMVCLYNDGSFFAERELQTEARRAIYDLLATYGCRILMVESLPAFITEDCLREARGALSDIQMIVGIGLQSASAEVRELCINSPVREDDFIEAIELLASNGVGRKAYVMLKPPFLTEDEAIKDACSTMAWLRIHNVQDITLCPTRVARGTVVSELFNRGWYSPPMLTSIGECLRSVHRLSCHARVSLFSCSDFQVHTPTGCLECEQELTDRIQMYNRNPLSVDPGTIFCRKCNSVARDRDPISFQGLSLRERVRKYVATC
jgi:archaeosine synthase beta-subunit